ncbi:MAG: hypothetical protein CMH60_03510 [Myxococcales bacterium]|nr:hypothetical protein [Myxococcales bacterium]|tara:strand:+ start:218 stop:616 length:399 start_codon:yes stop_codon:yes gene_type:complete
MKASSQQRPKRSLFGRLLILLPFWSFIGYIIVMVIYSVFANLYINEPHDHNNIAQRSWCHENLSYLSSRLSARKVSSDLHKTLFPHQEKLQFQKWLDKFEDSRNECAHFTDDKLLQEKLQKLLALSTGQGTS